MDAATEMRYAANTVKSLSDNLSDMVDCREKARELERENAKLRELVDAWMGCGTRYHTMKGGCPMFDESAEDFCKAKEMAHELGIEVSYDD